MTNDYSSRHGQAHNMHFQSNSTIWMDSRQLVIFQFDQSVVITYHNDYGKAHNLHSQSTEFKSLNGQILLVIQFLGVLSDSSVGRALDFQSMNRLINPDLVKHTFGNFIGVSHGSSVGPSWSQYFVIYVIKTFFLTIR